MKRKHPIFLLSEIDEKYISEANPENFRSAAKRKRFFVVLAAAALCITLTSSFALLLILNREEPIIPNPSEDTEFNISDYLPPAGEKDENNTLYSAKDTAEIIKAFIEIYAAPPAVSEDSSNGNNYYQTDFRPTHYFTLPHNNRPNSGEQGETRMVLGNYVYSAGNDSVQISEVHQGEKTTLCNVEIEYTSIRDKNDMAICAMHLSEDEKKLAVLLSDAFYTRSAIVTFDISEIYSGKKAIQLSFVKLSGGYVKSSYIDGKLILVTEQRVQKETFNINDLKTFFPFIETNGAMAYANIYDIYITPHPTQSVYTTIAEFDVKTDKLINAKHIIGGHDTHITSSAVYLEKSYIEGEVQKPNKSEVLRFAYTDEGLTGVGYRNVDGVIYKNMLSESNGVLQILSSNGNFYCFDATTLRKLSVMSSEASTYIYQTVRFKEGRAYLGHYCDGSDCDSGIDKSSTGMIVWTQTVEISNDKSITTSAPKQPYGSLVDFGDGYWLELKYEHSESNEEYSLVVSVLKESESGMSTVDSIVLQNRGLMCFRPDRTKGVITDEYFCDYYFDKENKLFGALLMPQSSKDPDEYMLWQFDTATEKLNMSQMNTNKYYSNYGGYYADGYFFTVTAAGDLATKLEK